LLPTNAQFVKATYIKQAIDIYFEKYTISMVFHLSLNIHTFVMLFNEAKILKQYG